VTGTLASGDVSEGDELVLLPAGIPVRVRGIQSHGQTAKNVTAGRRTAVNLVGVDHDQVTRGMVLTERDVLEPTQLLDCEIEMLRNAPRPLRSRQRVRVHVGTAEVLARVKVLNAIGENPPGDRDLIQLRLEEPVAAIPTQRLILRSYSPQITIGGGPILDISPPKHRGRDIARARESLKKLGSAIKCDAEWLQLLIEHSGSKGVSLSDIRTRTALSKKVITAAVSQLVSKKSVIDLGSVFISPAVFAALRQAALGGLHTFHATDPLAKGMTRESLAEKLGGITPEILNGVLLRLTGEGQVVVEGESVRLSSHVSELTGDDAKVTEALKRIYALADLEVPRLDEAMQTAMAGINTTANHAQKLLKLLLSRGEIVKVTDEFYFSRAAIDGVVASLRAFAGATTDRLIDVPKFKELTGVSRKYAIPLLEYLDAERITRRVGDKRVII